MSPAPSSCSARISIGPTTAPTAAGSMPNVRSVYADAVMPIAPNAPGRITRSSAHTKRNAGSGPNDSLTNTYTPPERGKAAASSEYVSAPHSTTMAPTTHAGRSPENAAADGGADEHCHRAPQAKPPGQPLAPAVGGDGHQGGRHRTRN